MARLDQIYANATQPPDPQAVSQPASADRSTSQPPAPAAKAPNAVSVSWIGVLLALVLLRVVYEVSE